MMRYYFFFFFFLLIWTFKIHERLKVILWRTGADVLPYSLKLSPTLMETNTVCPICNNDKKFVRNCGAFRHEELGVMWFSPRR